MSLITELQQRSASACELCTTTNNLKAYSVLPALYNETADDHILVCSTCFEQLENPDKITPEHWRCLNDSMWTQVPAVQVVIWRILNRLSAKKWAVALLDMLYLDDDTLNWAKSEIVTNEVTDEKVVHLDSNGVILNAGDTVIITQTLKVKGSSVTAKRGTAVRNISLVYDNPEHIEGRVNGQQIVILTKFVKKS